MKLNLFKKKSEETAEKASPPAERVENTGNNPYLRAREEWLERYGGYIQRAAQWRLAAVIALAIALVAITGNVIQLKQEKIIRYFIAYDELGNITKQARMDSPAGQTPKAVIQAEIANAIVSWRTVTVDTELQKRMIASLTAHTFGASRGVLKEWYDENNPFKTAESGKLVYVQIHGIPLPVSGNSYRVEWTEIVRNHQGAEMSRQDFQAIATVDILPPPDEETILKNPGGVYLTSLSVTTLNK